MQKTEVREVKRSFARRHLTALLIISMILLLLMTFYVYAEIYWSRSVETSIDVIGIDAILTEPNAAAWEDQIETTSLDGDNKIALTILEENFYDVWLNVTFTTNATGLDVSVVGQYFWCHLHPGASYYDAEPNGAAFDIPTATGYTVDKSLMMYALDETGGFLCLEIVFDTELVTVPGHYSVTLLFEMGFV